MTDLQSTNDDLNVSDVALELFKERSGQPGLSPRQLAIDCFRDAVAFTRVADDFLAGAIDLEADDENPLDAAHAPNLKKTHPINLMSRAWGDLEKVKSVMSDLDANPGADTYQPYEWGKPEVNQARYLFPTVISRAEQLALAK